MSFKSGNNPDIMFTNELLARTARECKVPLKSVEYLYQFALMYLYKQMDSTDCCAFTLPHIGTMYINYDHVLSKINEYEDRLKSDPSNTEYRKKKIAYEHKRDAIKEYLRITNRPKSYSNHFIKDKIFSQYYSHGKPIHEMVEIQNRVYGKNMDDI